MIPCTWALISAVLLAGPAGRPEQKTGEVRLQVTVEPGHLVLGTDQEATVRAKVVGPGVAPQDCSIELRVSTGALTSIVRSKDGELSARFLPPAKRYPQMAIITATARYRGKVLYGWTVLPLWGRGIVLVKSRPRARVRVQVGGREFGPVRANRRGRAQVPVVVPPGVRKATSSARKVVFDPPPLNRVAALAEKRQLVADTAEETLVRIFVVDETGRPAREAPVRLSADRGTVVSLAKPVAAGIFEARYRAPKEVSSGFARLSVSIEGDQASGAVLDFVILPGKSVKLTLQAEPKSHTAGQPDAVKLTATAFDSSDNPAPAEVSLASDIGKLSEPKSEGGSCVAELKIPDFFSGKRKASITAEAGPAGKAQTSVALEPAKAASITILKPAVPVVADGKTPKTVDLDIRDAFNNPTTATGLKVSATRGTAMVDQEGDRTFVRYTPPLSRRSGDFELSVSADGVPEGKAMIGLEDQPFRIALAPQAGYFTNFSTLHSPYFMLEASFNLPFLDRGFFLAAEGGYYYKSESTDDGDASVSAIPITASLVYRYQVTDPFRLQASVGGGICQILEEVTYLDQPTIYPTKVSYALTFSMGASYRIGPGDLTLGVRYLSTDGSEITTLQGDISGLAVLAGYRLGLF